MIRVLLVASVALLGACKSSQAFLPRERATGVGPRGQTAAEYVLVADDDPYGDVRLWSNGARDDVTEAGEDVLVVRVGFEIENRSEAELWIDEGSLEIGDARTVGGGTVPFELVAGYGDSKVAPGVSGVVDFEFEAPPDVRARGLDQFEVRWTLRDGAGELFTEATPFQAWDPPRRAYWGYDPFWGGFGGFGTGLFWGLHFRSVRCW